MGISLAIISIATAIVGAVVSAVSSIYAGVKQQEQYNAQADYAEKMAQYNADVIKQQAQYDAEIKEVNATIETNKGIREVNKARQAEIIERKNFAKLMASQEVQYASAGYMMKGSPLEVLGDTAEVGELSALNQRRAGEEAWQEREYNTRQLEEGAEFAIAMGDYNYEKTLIEGKNKADALKFQGQNAYTAGMVGGLTGFLGVGGKTGGALTDLYKASPTQAQSQGTTGVYDLTSGNYETANTTTTSYGATSVKGGDFSQWSSNPAPQYNGSGMFK